MKATGSSQMFAVKSLESSQQYLNLAKVKRFTASFCLRVLCCDLLDTGNVLKAMDQAGGYSSCT